MRELKLLLYFCFLGIIAGATGYLVWGRKALLEPTYTTTVTCIDSIGDTIGIYTTRDSVWMSSFGEDGMRTNAFLDQTDTLRAVGTMDGTIILERRGTRVKFELHPVTHGNDSCGL